MLPYVKLLLTTCYKSCCCIIVAGYWFEYSGVADGAHRSVGVFPCCLIVGMNSSWLVDRLYACLLIVSLPLLPAGDSQPALSRSSIQVPSPSDGDRQAALGDYGDEAAGHGDLGLGLPQTVSVRPHFGQTGGSLRLIINTGPDAKRQRFTPWGGKRTFDDSVARKRSKFQPWGGKRSARTAAAPRYANGRMSAYIDDSKREFHPWGGKRSI